MKYNFKEFIIPALVLFGLLISGIFYFFGWENWDHWILLFTMIMGLIPLLIKIVKTIIKGEFGVDLIALVAIGTSFFLQEYLAGTVILLMLSGGEALETFALRRARKELSSLLANAPSTAHIKKGDKIFDVHASEVQARDTIYIKPGEVVPVDSIVVEGVSDVNEAAITGEALPQKKVQGNRIYAGSINSDGALLAMALNASAESTYEKIIQLVKQAESTKAPVVRLADRYAVWFTAITFILAILAWLISNDSIRVLAVLVVATPCPLILATPIAIMSGIGQAAKRGIIVKNGGALEILGEIDAFILDKTGTLTLGSPRIEGALVFGQISPDEVLRLAASLDQLSGHVLARSLSEYAIKTRGWHLDLPNNFKEIFGDGVTGSIKGSELAFGKLDFMAKLGVAPDKDLLSQHLERKKSGVITVYLGRLENGMWAIVGAVKYTDKIRPETKDFFLQLKAQGLHKIVMLTGDKRETAEHIAKSLGLEDVHAECLPEDKVFEVKDHQRQFGKVAMVGDGVNDAPALAAADVGLALGAHGSSASSESGDIVITVDDLSRVAEGFAIAKRTMRIAKQSIFLGIGVSLIFMIVASLGYIKPVYGALLQELLDVAVILNALRANKSG